MDGNSKMLDEISREHLTRLKMATTNKLGRKDLARWITENTKIGGKPYGFKDHPWQLRVLEEESNEITLIKSAQLGASELSLRMAAAMIMTAQGNFSIGYLFPTSSFSMTYAKTRFGPICDESPALRMALSASDMNNAEVRSFGHGKNLMFRGCNSETAGLSHSLDALWWDEYSFMDQDKAKIYESRLIASKYRIKIKLSTPTHPGDPISTAFANSKRWVNFCKCNHCGHFFYPSFYDHVRVPGWDKHLDEIVEENLHRTNYLQAALHCPSCDKLPSMLPEHRQWVCENPSEKYVATGFRVSPFDVPTVVTVPYLVQVSTQYNRKADFRNFNLGLAAEDAESGLTEGDLDAIGVEMPASPFTTHVAGYDLGMTCHVVVAGISGDGKMGIVHYERIPLARFRERYFALKAQYNVTMTCSDQYPYTDMVMSLSADDMNLYGCTYTTRTGMDVFEVRQREEDAEHAIGALRQVSINRSSLFDRLMIDVREGRLWVRKTSDWELFRAHAIDQKRASAQLRNGEFTSTWQKSAKGNDHFWHATAYAWVAGKMRGLAHGMSLPPSVRTFKVKPKA
jgi:hypothetical protein